MNDDDGWGLHDLFSIKDYKKETIEIPCYCSLSSRIEGELTIELLHSGAGATDPDLTGQVLWPVSRLLSHYLASDRIDLNGKSVLELGSGGTALPSISAAFCGASTVIATDGNEGPVFDLLHRNIGNWQCPSCDQARLPRLSCRQMLWGNRNHIQSLRNDNQNRPFDVILAADVVQWPAVVEPLLHTVVAAMWSDDADRFALSPGPCFILGIVERSTAVYDQFFALAHAMGFVCREIDPKEYLPNGSIPHSCQEYGGRSTKLFELTMNQSFTNVPLLLQQNFTGDCILGSSFERTVFLPC
jgi:Lysine methyltransferase